jgi:serine/threonine-protein kinase
VTIRAGVLSPLTITPPMGRLSINAEPWAQVLIDDRPIGDTPLANVSVSLGEHEVVFRHPQLGERRETVTVRADVPTRVSTTFQR